MFFCPLTFLVSSSLLSASSTCSHGASGTCNFSPRLLFCELLGPSHALSQLAGALLEPLGLLLKLWGASWCVLGAFWEHLGRLLGPLGCFLGLLLGPLGRLLGASWGLLGASWRSHQKMLRNRSPTCPIWAPQMPPKWNQKAASNRTQNEHKSNINFDIEKVPIQDRLGLILGRFRCLLGVAKRTLPAAALVFSKNNLFQKNRFQEPLRNDLGAPKGPKMDPQRCPKTSQKRSKTQPKKGTPKTTKKNPKRGSKSPHNLAQL